MTETHRCPQCRTALPASAPAGFCPVCEFRHALDPPSAQSQSENPDCKLEASDLTKIRYFGDYELLETIAQGGMGIVFKARQVSLNRLVALKLISAGVLASQEIVKRFKAEAEAAASLDHPNIVPIHEIGEHQGQHYFSMTLISGPTLGQALARKPMPIRRAAEMLTTLARAVHFAHQRGVLHRDIKPSNILLDEQGEPHLTDFGLAKLIQDDSSLTQTAAVMGTPAYMSPEQARGDSKAVTIAADVYGLGAVLYETLAGRPPFGGGSSVETIGKVLEQEPRRPSLSNPEVDRDLETICLKCLEKTPHRRYPSAQALADDLERWQRHESIVARPTGPVRRTTRWIQRNPVGASLIVSLFVGLVVSLVLLKIALDQKNAATEAQLAMDRARDIIWQQIGVSDFWEKPNATATVTSEILAMITGSRRSFPTTGETERYRIGMLLEEYPVDVIVGYAHLLLYLENRLSKSRGHSVRLDLRLYQENGAGIEALIKQEVDVLKIGGRSYLRASKADPGITPLVSQQPAKTGVIFGRKNSGIKTLADLTNKRIAVGGVNSTIRLWAAFYLKQGGVADTTFRGFEQLSGDPALIADRLRKAPKLGKGQKISGLSPVIQVVLSNGCDAGVVSKQVFDRVQSTNAALVALKTFPSSPVFWLAGSRLPPDIANSFKQAMVSLRDPALFHGLADHVTSYAGVAPDELNALRQAASLITEPPGGENEESE